MQSMKKASVLLGALLIIPLAQASHHFEAAQYLQDTRVAQVDNFIFPSAKAGNTAVVMTVNYDPKPKANQTFNPNAIYSLHFATDKDLKTGKTLSLTFAQNSYTVYEINEPNPEPGTLGKKIGTGKIGDNHTFANGMQSFAGIVQDPFYGNSLALGAFRKNIVNAAYQYDPAVWTSVSGKNIFEGRQVGAIVLDVPNTMLGTEIFAFFTTDLKVDKQWKQVQYSAIPLLSHTLLLDNVTLRQAHDAHRPGDAYNAEMKAAVAASVLRATLAANSQQHPAEYAEKIANTVVPDVIHYNVGTPAKFAVNNINGRTIDDDAMSVVLTWLLGTETDQAIVNPKKHTTHFPYVIPVK